MPARVCTHLFSKQFCTDVNLYQDITITGGLFQSPDSSCSFLVLITKLSNYKHAKGNVQEQM